MNYAIIPTLGPASQAETIWEALISAGATAFRLNTSHLSEEQLHAWLDRLNIFWAALKTPVPLILDLQGSKWRLGRFTPLMLETGSAMEFILAESSTQANTLPVPHPDFFRAASTAPGEIVLNDARIRLQIAGYNCDTLSAVVTQGGKISPGKGITLTACPYRQESWSEKDRRILEKTHHLPEIRYAISYVRDAVEMACYRSFAGPESYLIAKVEREPAVSEAVSIAEHANELWLCRGDLGAELGLPAMAKAVHHFSGQIARLAAPVMLAGQVLEHMTTQTTPTRSEVCCLYDALQAGYKGFVLSDETAIGNYPVESCRMAALFRD